MTRKNYLWFPFFMAVIFLPGLLLAQSASSLIAKGNSAYEEKNYSQAENYYRQAMNADPQHEFPEATFNLGNALFMQKKFDEASKQFQQIINSKRKTDYTARAYYNLGNCLLAQKKFPQSTEAYKKTLLLNPKDNDARYNLSLALALMNHSITSTPSNIPLPSAGNIPKEQPLSEEEMKNLLSQLNHEESLTLDSMKRRTYSPKQKKDW